MRPVCTHPSTSNTYLFDSPRRRPDLDVDRRFAWAHILKAGPKRSPVRLTVDEWEAIGDLAGPDRPPPKVGRDTIVIERPLERERRAVPYLTEKQARTMGNVESRLVHNYNRSVGERLVAKQISIPGGPTLIRLIRCRADGRFTET